MKNRTIKLTNEDIEVISRNEKPKFPHKETLVVCCTETVKIIKASLDVGLTRDELEVFVKAFHGHPFDQLTKYPTSLWEETINGRKTYKVGDLAEAIFEFAGLLEENPTKDLFLDKMIESIEIQNKSYDNIPLDMAVMKVKKLIKNKQRDSVEKDTVPTHMQDSQSNYHKEKLRPFIKDLAKMDGYDSPIPFLDEMLRKVKAFDDFSFTGSFYLRIYQLCQEHKDLFWCDSHRLEITNWLKKAPIVGMTEIKPIVDPTNPENYSLVQGENLFDTMWNGRKEQKPSTAVTLLQFFLNNEDRVEQFLSLARDHLFIDTEKRYTYMGDDKDFAALFRVLYDFRGQNGKAIIQPLDRSKLHRMLEIEFSGLPKFYQTLKKAFSTTDSQRIDNDDPIYISLLEEVKEYFR